MGYHERISCTLTCSKYRLVSLCQCEHLPKHSKREHITGHEGLFQHTGALRVFSRVLGCLEPLHCSTRSRCRIVYSAPVEYSKIGQSMR